MKIVNGEKIDRVFLVKNYEVKNKKNGGNYLDLTLLDKDNCIKGKLWSIHSNLIDDLSAKIYEFNSATENIDPGTFSQKVFALGNIQVYKPDI